MSARLKGGKTGADVWQKTKIPNLFRYVPSGIYFARVRIGGKLIRHSLKTDVYSVAQLRLSDFIHEERRRSEGQQSQVRGKMDFGDALTIYQRQLLC